MKKKRSLPAAALWLGLAAVSTLPGAAEQLILEPLPGETVHCIDYGFGIFEFDYLLEGALVVELDGDVARALPAGLTSRLLGEDKPVFPWPGWGGDHLYGTRSPEGVITLDGATIGGGHATFLLSPADGEGDHAYDFTGEITFAGDPSRFCGWNVDMALTTSTEAIVLPGGRFSIEATWNDGRGKAGTADGRAATPDSAYLWFFSPSNPELMVKVLDACKTFGRFWVFAAGLTDVGVRLEVTDRRAGVSWEYETDPGQGFPPIRDTRAFSTCDAGSG